MKYPKVMKIICVGIWQGYDGYEYDEVILREAQETGAKFVYISDLFEEKGNKSTIGTTTPWGPADDFHPNAHGHDEISKRILRALSD